jgi:hypothetical protein
MKNTLIVHHDSNKINLALLTILSVIAGLVFWLIFCFNLKAHINHCLLILLQATFIIAISFFLIGLAYGYFFKQDEPAAILSSQGIWIKHYGLIPWDNIIQIRTYTLPNAPLEVIGIQAKNIMSISVNASFAGKCGLFWAKLFGYQYQITLSCLALENDEVLDFARQFI